MEPAFARRRMTAERLDRFAQAWARCDLDELGDYLTDDVVYSPVAGGVVSGREAVIRRFAEVLAANAGCELSLEPATVSGSLGVSRWRLSVPTGQGASFVVEGITVYAFEGDRIRRTDAYQKA
jgi:ketosteroid isomerase-like protein